MHLVPDTPKTVSGQQKTAFRCVDQKETYQNRDFPGCSRTFPSFDIMTWSSFPPSTQASPTFSHPGIHVLPEPVLCLDVRRVELLVPDAIQQEGTGVKAVSTAVVPLLRRLAQSHISRILTASL